MLAAQARLFGVDDNGTPRFSMRIAGNEQYGIGEVMAKARQGEAITEDEYIVVNLGFLPGEERA